MGSLRAAVGAAVVFAARRTRTTCRWVPDALGPIVGWRLVVNTPGARRRMLVHAARRGAVAGLAGVAAMTIAEKAEQTLSHRPNSHVPGRTLLALVGARPDDRTRRDGWNHAMHWSTGALLGALRGVWAVTGIRGPSANVTHTFVRLAFDQTLENATGVGAPPDTWPRGERWVDVTHKAVYSLVTGAVADRMVPPFLVSRRGTTSH